MMPYLALGPVFFNWEPARWRDFYLAIADAAPIDIVYLGETVCAKRAPFTAPYVEEVVERLAAAGKRVVISSLALIGNEREAAALRALCADAGLTIEANDFGTARLLAGRAHALGPFLNIYNEGTLGYLAAAGAERVCLSPELPAASIARLAASSPVPLEIIAFGRLPLAISARCFHARAHGLHKDGCQFVCGEDANGLAVATLEGEAFLAVNGTQVLSHSCCSLLRELRGLARSGIAGFRLLPLAADMVAVARLFRGVLDGREDAEAATAALASLLPDLPLANGFVHGAPGRSFQRAALFGAE